MVRARVKLMSRSNFLCGKSARKVSLSYVLALFFTLYYTCLMPKLTNEVRAKIAPFLLVMLRSGLSLREIQDTLSSVKPLTWQAVKDILDRFYPQEYNEIIKGRKKTSKNE